MHTRLWGPSTSNSCMFSHTDAVQYNDHGFLNVCFLGPRPFRVTHGLRLTLRLVGMLQLQENILKSYIYHIFSLSVLRKRQCSISSFGGCIAIVISTCSGYHVVGHYLVRMVSWAPLLHYLLWCFFQILKPHNILPLLTCGGWLANKQHWKWLQCLVSLGSTKKWRQ